MCGIIIEEKYILIFGIPRTIISDRGSHFYSKVFKAVLEKYDVRQHKVATPYHPQIGGKVKVSNNEIKMILAKSVNANLGDWSQKLDDALWAYSTTFNTLIDMLTYQLVFVKTCRLPVELEHKAFWALKWLNLSWKKVVDLRLDQLKEIDEFRIQAYEMSSLYKERMKLYLVWKIEKREFQIGDVVLLLNLGFKLFPGNIKLKWSNSFKVAQVFALGVVDLENRDGKLFIVNEKCIKHYVAQ